MNSPTLPTDLYTSKTFYTLSGASMGVWLMSAVFGDVFGFNPKWFALLIALILSFLGAKINKANKTNELVVAFFNGLLIYTSAVGINSIYVSRENKYQLTNTKSNLSHYANIFRYKHSNELMESSFIIPINDQMWFIPKQLIDSIYAKEEIIRSQSEYLSKLKVDSILMDSVIDSLKLNISTTDDFVMSLKLSIIQYDESFLSIKKELTNVKLKNVLINKQNERLIEMFNDINLASKQQKLDEFQDSFNILEKEILCRDSIIRYYEQKDSLLKSSSKDIIINNETKTRKSKKQAINIFRKRLPKVTTIPSLDGKVK